MSLSWANTSSVRRVQLIFDCSRRRARITVGIALAMYEETRFSNHISKVAFQRAIIRLIDGFPDELRKYEPVTGDVKGSLRDRLHDREMLIETVSTDVRSCGVIVTDLSQIDTFKFSHKSFFELLFAKNVIYTGLSLPIEKDKILHHAARVGLMVDMTHSAPYFVNSAMVAALNPAGHAALNHEMIQFGGEILYRLAGVNRRSPLSEVEQRLTDFRIPVGRLRHIAFMLARRGAFGRLAAANEVILLFFSNRRLPPAIISILACFYDLHGSGGEGFKEYYAEEIKMRTRMRKKISTTVANQ